MAGTPAACEEGVVYGQDVKVKEMKIIWAKPSFCHQIDLFLEDNPSASIFHTPRWNQIVADVFHTRFFYLVAMSGNKIIGAMPCHIVRRHHFDFVCYSLPRIFEVSYGGPVANGDVAQQACICRKLVCSAGRIKLGNVVSLFNSPENTSWTEDGNWQRRTLETAYVDLMLSLEEIWNNSINGKRRNMIRKAEKNGVELEVCGAEKVSAYFEIVQQMTQRTGITLKPEEYYRRILESFGPHDMARLYLARHKGVYLSGGIFLKYGQLCYYWHGATASNVPNLGQSELIQWQVIQWAKQSGCRWYDLVGVEREKLPNIAKFKLGFTRNLVPFHSVRYTRFVDKVVRRVTYTFLRGGN